MCCETYKFHERVQLDSITSNELGDPDALAAVPLRPEVTTLQGWRSEPCLGVRAPPCPLPPCHALTVEKGGYPQHEAQPWGCAQTHIARHSFKGLIIPNYDAC